MTVVVGATVASDAEVVAELRAAWAEVSRGYARCWAAMVEVDRRSPATWGGEEIAAALVFTRRRADLELDTALVLARLPRVAAALAAGVLDHPKARIFADHLREVTPEQADTICARLVGPAAGWTTGQLAARLLREIHAIDPDHTRRSYEQAVRDRGVHGYLDETGTAVLTGSGLPAPEAAAAAARLEALADALRAAGYPATVHQTRADLFLRLLDGTLDGHTHQQILATMLRLGPITPANPGTDPADPAPEPERKPERPVAREPEPALAGSLARPTRYGVEVRVGLSTLLGLDDHPAEVAGWGPVPATAARDLVAVQHGAEWRIAITDADGYLAHGDLTRRRPAPLGARGDCRGGIVEIAVPATMLDQLPALAVKRPEWARVLEGITGMWEHRKAARAALDAHPDRRFAHAALRRHIQMRDRYCVGVGCRRRAAAADLDHTREHARGGPTVTSNSGPCCGRHHEAKHQAGWTLEQPEPGQFIWTSPLGQKYRTRGGPVLPDLPDPLPRDHEPRPADTALPLKFDGPILRQPPAPPPPARPPPPELPDEPPF